jgi:L-threonylcarbamoyladenylate synthase
VSVFDFDPNDDDDGNAIRTAVNVIQNGGVVVYPTDTVYGLGADALNPVAVQRVFAIKNRPMHLPLPVVVRNVMMTKRLAVVDESSQRLIDAFWPGALTIILEKKSLVPHILTSGGVSVGLRMPNHPVPLQMLELAGVPLVATSANKHGGVSPLSAEEAQRQLGHEVDLILDGGTANGQPSTIIDMTKMPPLLVRRGPISRDAIEAIIGKLQKSPVD